MTDNKVGEAISRSLERSLGALVKQAAFTTFERDYGVQEVDVARNPAKFETTLGEIVRPNRKRSFDQDLIPGYPAGIRTPGKFQPKFF